jgi:GNAT superfamily N-acetyltransferase
MWRREASRRLLRGAEAHLCRRCGARSRPGRRLLERLEQCARDLGYERVRLDTGDLQPEALERFRSAGYEEIPDYNGNTWATYWMEKRLA